MRWVWFITLGLIGWGIRFSGVKLVFAGSFPWWSLLLIGVPLLVVGGVLCLHAAWGADRLLNPFTNGLEAMATDAKTWAERRTGDPRGWPYQLVKWSSVIWFFGGVCGILAIFPFGSD